MQDKLETVFEIRENFMKAIRASKGAYGNWPVDMGDKKSQQMIREITLKGVEEMFEALGELKNWKSHRDTENRSVDREKFVEEFIDAQNYFLAVLILCGVTADEFYEAFCKKDKIIHDRLTNGY